MFLEKFKQFYILLQSAISVFSALLAVEPENMDCLGNLGIAYLQRYVDFWSLLSFWLLFNLSGYKYEAVI